MPAAILAIVDDLFFLAKIREAAKRADVAIETAEPGNAIERLQAAGARAVVIDLNHRAGNAIETIHALRSRPETRTFILGFVSHVRADLVAAARQAGCDEVLARSAFSRDLPEILTRLAAA